MFERKGEKLGSIRVEESEDEENDENDEDESKSKKAAPKKAEVDETKSLFPEPKKEG